MAIAAPISRSFIMASYKKASKLGTWRSPSIRTPYDATFRCQKRHLGMGMTDSSDAEYDRHDGGETTASLHYNIIAALENPQLF